MMTILLFITIILLVVSGMLMLDVTQLTSVLKGKESFQVSEKKNKTQGFLFIVFLVWFYGFIGYQLYKWVGSILPESASYHGEGYDTLMWITMVLISFVFFVLQIVLFYLAYKYSYSTGREVKFFTHSNKLEIIWTIIPSSGLAILISYGLYNWNSIMEPVAEDEDHVLIELYAKQFDWTARYAGEDMKFGRADISYIDGANQLGIDSSDVNCKDDKIVKGEFHIPVDVPVQFMFRAQDVMHSAYMPHFRAQMNCVPGIRTQFNFKPKYTTAQMKDITKDEDFEYVLICNKICGAAHYNMQMKIVVDSAEDYKKWIDSQKEFIQ